MGFAGVTMSLGWGLRGYIGGGPLGAMIPGALVALALCLLLRRDDVEAGLIAAFGAVGVGFGGQMTYGQTIGLSKDPETMWWGLLGLGVKGAVWGLLGGGVIGLALVRRQYRRSDIVAGCALLCAGTYAGWKLINEPKLIYFSNRYDQPRPEIWAGLLLGGLALLAYLWWRRETRIPHWFAAIAFAGGGLGFFLGGWIQVVGLREWPNPLIDWWKVMEFTFGLLFGMALGWAAWRSRSQLLATSTGQSVERSALAYAVVLTVAAAILFDVLPLRFDYTVAGALLLVVASRPTMAAWHIAVTLTATAFFLDAMDTPDAKASAWSAYAVAAASAATAWAVERFAGALNLFLFVLVASVLDSVVKSQLHDVREAHLYVEVAFAGLMLLVLTWLMRLRRDALATGALLRRGSIV